MTLRILAMVEIICYNAVRQNVKGVHGDTKNENVSMVTRKMKTPEVATPGFSIPFWEGGLCPRLTTSYFSPSSHLHM